MANMITPLEETLHLTCADLLKISGAGQSAGVIEAFRTKWAAIWNSFREASASLSDLVPDF